MFSVRAVSPELIRSYFPSGIANKTMLGGRSKGAYTEQVELKRLASGSDGCKEYSLPASKHKVALLLEETDFCPIALRAGHAVTAGAKALIIKYNNDALDDLVFRNEIIRGMDLPVLFISKSDAQFLQSYLSQEDESQIEPVLLELSHSNQIDQLDKSLTIVMDSYAKENLAIPFLSELQSYLHAFKGYQVNVLFTIRQDQSA